MAACRVERERGCAGSGAARATSGFGWRRGAERMAAVSGGGQVWSGWHRFGRRNGLYRAIRHERLREAHERRAYGFEPVATPSSCEHLLLFGLEAPAVAGFLDWRLRSISRSEYVKRSTKTLSLACKAHVKGLVVTAWSTRPTCRSEEANILAKTRNFLKFPVLCVTSSI